MTVTGEAPTRTGAEPGPRLGPAAGPANRGSARGLVVHATGWYLVNRIVTGMALAAALIINGPESRPRDLVTLGDGRWYLLIAENGYQLSPGGDLNLLVAFFPLLPALIRAVDTVAPGGDVAAAIVVCAVAGWAATVAVALLARDIYGDATARRATALFAAFPGTFIYVCGEGRCARHRPESGARARAESDPCERDRARPH